MAMNFNAPPQARQVGGGLGDCGLGTGGKSKAWFSAMARWTWSSAIAEFGDMKP